MRDELNEVKCFFLLLSDLAIFEPILVPNFRRMFYITILKLLDEEFVL